MKDKTIKLLDDWKVNEFKQELMAEELLILCNKMKNTEIKLILQKILLRNEQRKVNNLIPSDILDIKDIISQLTIPVMEENFKQREKILDIMDSNIDARLALYGTDGTHG